MLKKISITILILLALFFLVFLFAKLTKDTNVVSEKIDSVNFIDDIFEFGNSGAGPIENIVDFIEGNDSENQNDVSINNEKVLLKVSSMPISGYGILDKERYISVPDINPEEVITEGENVAPSAPETEIVSVVKYASKENGNIFQTFADLIDERKFSETRIPYIYESFFTKRSVIMRYLDNNNIATFVGELPQEILGKDLANGNEIFGDFLPENIRDISFSKDGNKIFYLTNTNKGVVGTVMDSDGLNKKQIFDSAFSEWTSSWTLNNKIVLTTKPSGLVPGYSYLLDINNGNYIKILGDINGLTTLINDDNSLMLYADQNSSLKIFDLNKGRSKDLRLFGQPEKCVWGADNITLYCAIPKNIPTGLIYPDIWYQGEISFDDEIFKINTETGKRDKILDPSVVEEGGVMDIVNLKLDKQENNLFFVNKNDAYLWRVKIN